MTVPRVPGYRYSAIKDKPVHSFVPTIDRSFIHPSIRQLIIIIGPRGIYIYRSINCSVPQGYAILRVSLSILRGAFSIYFHFRIKKIFFKWCTYTVHRMFVSFFFLNKQISRNIINECNITAVP